jgi:hypothetical protein
VCHDQDGGFDHHPVRASSSGSGLGIVHFSIAPFGGFWHSTPMDRKLRVKRPDAIYRVMNPAIVARISILMMWTGAFPTKTLLEPATKNDPI